MQRKSNIITIDKLSHYYGKKKIYEDLNLEIQKGSIFGILGKNGVGKSTLINILMGYIKPKSGKCLIFGENSHEISPQTKQKIALLHEGFIAYDFLTIKQYEEFFGAFYKGWKKNLFYELIELMDVNCSQKISTLSFGQKSQVILGTLFAQDAELLILDDYSMGLDAGYRRLFVEYLKDYIEGTKKTVLITSHTMNDLESLLDSFIIVQSGGKIYKDTMKDFNKDKSTTFEDKFLDFVGKY